MNVDCMDEHMNERMTRRAPKLTIPRHLAMQLQHSKCSVNQQYWLELEEVLSMCLNSYGKQRATNKPGTVPKATLLRRAGWENCHPSVDLASLSVKRLIFFQLSWDGQALY